MANLDQTERGHVMATRDALGDGKEALRTIASEMRKMAKYEREAGRLVASAECHKLEGAALECLGLLIGGHAVAMGALAAAFDDGGVVILGGGGGR